MHPFLNKQFAFLDPDPDPTESTSEFTMLSGNSVQASHDLKANPVESHWIWERLIIL